MAPVVLFRAAVALAGRFPALAGVDLSLDQGEVMVVVGPNGAGKTSLLRACAGLLPVTSGEANVLGVDLTADHAAVRRFVGLLGHAAPIYDELSAAENVRFAVRALGLPVKSGDEALGRLGITGRLRSTPAGRLSAGQRRRVALAALVARRPALWLLDEPHAGLDAGSRALLGELIGEAASSGASVLLSSHEPHLSVPLADRVVSMVGGRVVGEEPGGRRVTLTAVPAPGPATRREPWGPRMWHDAVLVAGKDLRIEARSRVGLWQVVPFAILVLVLLAFAIGPDRTSLQHAAPGIFWVALLFSTVLAIQRSVAVESGEGTRDGLRLSGIDPAGIFLGKAAAIGLQLIALQVILWAGVTFLFDVRIHVDLAGRRRQPAGDRRSRVCRRALWGDVCRVARARHAAAAVGVARPRPGAAGGLQDLASRHQRQRLVGYPVAQDPHSLRRHLPDRRHRAVRATTGGGVSSGASVHRVRTPGARGGSRYSASRPSSRRRSRSGWDCG